LPKHLSKLTLWRARWDLLRANCGRQRVHSISSWMSFSRPTGRVRGEPKLSSEVMISWFKMSSAETKHAVDAARGAQGGFQGRADGAAETKTQRIGLRLDEQQRLRAGNARVR